MIESKQHASKSLRTAASAPSCPVLVLGLITLLMVACSGPGSDEQLSGRTELPRPQPESPSQIASTPIINGPRPEIEIEESTALAFEIDSADRDASAPGDRSNRVDTQVIVTGSSLREAHVGTLSSQMVVQDQLSYNRPATNRENYLAIAENSVKHVADDPVSTFSIDVDTAAYSNLRRMLSREGRLPPHDAVRLEEMINYFDYDYTAPDSLTRPLAVHTETMISPWNPGNHLLMVGMKGFEPGADSRPDANLVFLVDVSGSMQSPDKLELVKRSLQLLVSQMRAEDRIALVVYAGAAGLVLDSTPGSEQTKIIAALDSLTAGGSTNGAAGIQLAYQVAEENRIENGINRVIIASDGDLNVGMTSIEALREMIARKRENGIALTTLGFGSGNYNYSLMEQLADTGNGNAAYIDSLAEAQKVLVEEMQSTLITIAKDVKIQIEFNPDLVAEYRLIGYENRLLNREDFRNDRVDAGEVGAGHTVTALYEISLKGSDGALIPELRYGQAESVAADFGNEIAYVNVRYKMPDAARSTEFGQPVLRPTTDGAGPSDNIRFAAAVAGFGQLLRGGTHTSDWDYTALLELARQSRGDDPHGYRAEMLKLVELARVL